MTTNALRSRAGRLALPRWVLVWFIVTAIIQTYDACYVLLGPLSHTGGPLSWLWAGHVLYGNYDATYGGTHSDAWGEAQSWLNLIEVVVLLVILANRRKPVAVVLGLIVSTATFWKTVAYFAIEICSGLAKTQHSLEQGDLAGFLFIGVLPNLFWIVIPLLVVIALGRQVHAVLHEAGMPAELGDPANLR
ncbi:MAG TPA: hypothetical protein VNQ48_05210 [Microbacteriaceae bacterium]|nr:hypothetical protein [Microbacteriaceae bacterium]